jgi:hypothetical protein
MRLYGFVSKSIGDGVRVGVGGVPLKTRCNKLLCATRDHFCFSTLRWGNFAGVGVIIAAAGYFFQSRPTVFAGVFLFVMAWGVYFVPGSVIELDKSGNPIERPKGN